MVTDNKATDDKPDAAERFRIGLRVALEEIVNGKDYARVETILRILSNQADRRS